MIKMLSKNLSTLGVVVGAVAVTTATAFAAGGTNSENRDAVHAAIESGDYSAFVELVPENSRMLESINEGNFSLLQEAHELKESGDFEGAKEIMDELGIRPHGHRGKGPMMENHEEVKSAIESGDYEAFLEAVSEDSPFGEEMSEEKFQIMVQAHELKESGDYEAARELMEEAGFEKKHKFGKGSEETRAAIESGDYEAFLATVPEDSRFAEEMNEEKFQVMVQAHELKESGDYEGAKELMEEAGFEMKHKFGKEMRGNGMKVFDGERPAAAEKAE